MTANRVHPADDVSLPTGDANLIDASEPVPESDRLEQLTPVDPAAGPDFAALTGEPTSTVGGIVDEPSGPVDEADWLEQQLPVPAAEGDDEEYPPDLSGPSSPISP